MKLPGVGNGIPTLRQIRALPPGKYGLGQNLWLHVKRSGRRSYVFRYTRPVTKAPNETTLGDALALTYHEARSEMERLRQLLAKGTDPVQHKIQQRALKVTFAEAAESWIATHQSSWHGGSQLKNARLVLFKHGKPLANKLVSEITPDMVQNAIAPLWAKTPKQGRRALSMWAKVFDYAKANQMRTGDNPASWRGNLEYRLARVPKSAKNNFEALPYEELPEFIRRLRIRQKSGTSAVALEFLVLTAARTGEVLGAKWDEFDPEYRIWTIPAERMKNKERDHTVPLPYRATELLRRLREQSDSEYVFTGYNRVALDKSSMRVVLHNMDVCVAGMGRRVTVHGFRSTFKDWCEDENNFSRRHIEECLSHAVGSPTEQAYRRRTGLAQRRVIMEKWALYCESIHDRS